MALEDRIRRLEAAAGQARQESEDDARRRRIYDKLYHALENGRREKSGRDPLPPLEVSPEDERADVLHSLRVTIPRYRQSLGYQHGAGKEFLAQWQDELLEKLAALPKGDDDE